MVEAKSPASLGRRRVICSLDNFPNLDRSLKASRGNILEERRVAKEEEEEEEEEDGEKENEPSNNALGKPRVLK